MFFSPRKKPPEPAFYDEDEPPRLASLERSPVPGRKPIYWLLSGQEVKGDVF
ncbi:MAG TPA: hypothetical protein VLE96_07370 [Chlamydiales bacterium]|nr:hypothetical protein [Chlamydiales bacterium]